MIELPSGTIMLWLGSATSIPAGWQIYTAAIGKLIRGVPSGGSAGQTGGTETHTHDAGTVLAGGSHNHPNKDITHSIKYADKSIVQQSGSGKYAVASHSHPGYFILDDNANHNHTLHPSYTGNADHLPPYKKGIYIIKV